MRGAEGSQVGRLGKEERKGSLGTKRSYPGKPFRSNKSPRNSASIEAAKGENPLSSARVERRPYLTFSSFSTFPSRMWMTR